MASSSTQQNTSRLAPNLDQKAAYDLLTLESASASSPTGSEPLRANSIADTPTPPTSDPPIIVLVCKWEIYFQNGTCIRPTWPEFKVAVLEMLASDAKTLVVEFLLPLMRALTPRLSLIVLQTYGTLEGLKKVLHRKGGLSQRVARSISAIVALPLISIGFYVYFGSFYFIASFVVYVFYRWFTGE